MKKSLILSVVMTLVLVISMSTATFAWYTSNDRATITASTITAQSTSGNLCVSVTPDSGETVSNSNGSQASYVVGGQFFPAAPVANTDFATVSNWVYNSDSKGILLTALGGFDGFVETGTIEVFDDSENVTQFTVSIELSSDFTSNQADGDFACIVTNSSSGPQAWTQYDTVAKSGDVYTDNATAITAQTTSTNISMNPTGVTLKYYIWFNGKTMANADAETSFSVKFTVIDTTNA